MAAVLKSELNGATYEAVPMKLERRKPCGYVDTVATDAAGKK